MNIENDWDSASSGLEPWANPLEIGRGSTWTEAATDLVKKIYDIPEQGPIFH